MTYKCNFKIKKVKKYLSAVKRIGQGFVMKGTLNRKVGSSCPNSSTIKPDHRLKMIFKGYKEMFVEHINRKKKQQKKLFCQIEGNGIFIKNKWKKCFQWSTKVFFQYSHFKLVVFLCCGNSGATRTNFSVNCAFHYKPLSNSLHS